MKSKKRNAGDISNMLQQLSDCISFIVKAASTKF